MLNKSSDIIYLCLTEQELRYPKFYFVIEVVQGLSLTKLAKYFIWDKNNNMQNFIKCRITTLIDIKSKMV